MPQAPTNTTVPSSKREHLIHVNGREVDEATYERIVNAKPKRTRAIRCNPTRPFTLLR